jgi:hypothetical protein
MFDPRNRPSAMSKSSECGKRPKGSGKPFGQFQSPEPSARTGFVRRGAGFLRCEENWLRSARWGLASFGALNNGFVRRLAEERGGCHARHKTPRMPMASSGAVELASFGARSAPVRHNLSPHFAWIATGFVRREGSWLRSARREPNPCGDHLIVSHATPPQRWLRSARGPLASFGAAAIGFIRRTAFFSGLRPPSSARGCDGDGSIRIANEQPGPEVPPSSSGGQAETSCDSRHDARIPGHTRSGWNWEEENTRCVIRTID